MGPRFVLLYLIGSFRLTLCEITSTETTCPGICINKDLPCNDALEDTDCDFGLKCCIDGMKISMVTTEENDEAIVEVDDFETITENLRADMSTIEPSEVAIEITTEAFEYDTCPGVCIPNEHASLCKYEIRSTVLCGEEKTCCASKDKLNQYKIDTITAQGSENYCPGKCVHPSLTIFCERIIEGRCPFNSKCCESNIAADSVTSFPTKPMKCSGVCLSTETAHLCLPPFQPVPGKDCKQTQICCMNANGGSKAVSEAVLASDENGRVYYVYQNGEIKPLEILSLEDAANQRFAHYTDVQVDAGKVSLFRDSLGILYQLYASERDQYESDQNSEDMSLSDIDQGPEKLLETISLPDDSDDVEENMQDLILPDVGEEIQVADFQIPPGERTMVKPQCPGKCISPLLRLTCVRNQAIHDGFACPSNSVCCASLSDIEKNQHYLKSLSSYFTAFDGMNPQDRQTCGIKKSGDKASRDAVIEEWCWQAAIINNHNQYVCGGAIIESNWILTAAHCVTGPLRQNQALYARAGVTDLSSADESTVGQTRRIFSVYVHHNHNSVSLDHDIALVRLQSPFTISSVCSICLPALAMPISNDCMVTGYGFINKGKMSLRLQQAPAPLVDDLDCISNITDALNTLFILPESSFCAGTNGNLSYGRDACQGDAGGPLVCKKNHQYELVGLLSWGLDCGDFTAPNIYVKVSAFITWINQIINTSGFLKALS